MNKTVFPLVMAVLTACPVLFSCTEKEQEVPVENKIYEYRFELAGDDTRAYLNDDGVFWELNDHVGLFTPTESLVAAVNTDASPKTIDVQSSTSLAVGTKVYAYYPYVEENTSVSASKVLFPAEQSGGSISAMPLAGIPAEVVTEGKYNGVIRFLNLGSVIDFRVFSLTHNNETVESISLKADAGNLAGTATIDLTGVDWDDETNTATIPNLTWADGAGSSTVTLTQSAPVAADKDAAIADGNLYMVVAPGTVASGTITITTNAARYTFPITNQTFKQNGLKRFNMNLDNATEREDRFVTINLEEADELVAGEKYVLVSNGFALVRDGSAASAAAFDATAMTIAVPTDLQSNVEWTLGTNTDSNNRGNVYDFSNGGYFFGILMNTAQNPYTYSVALNTSKQVATNQTMQNHNVNVETGYVYYRGNSSSQYIYYDTEAQAWTNHAADNGTFDAAYGTKLYKLKDMRAEQQLAYSVDAATYDLGTNTWTPSKPTLSGAQGDVTYNSSDEGVATVSVTGEVTPLKKGTTRITASADGNADYKPGTAFYDLTVINSQTVLVTYYKATQFDSGYQYMIVSGGMALKNAGNGEIVDAESVTVENDQITREEDPALLWTAADAPELDNYYYGTHTLTSGTEHLWRHSNNGKYTVEGSNASVTKYMIWSYEAEKLWNISVYDGNSSTYYTYYDNGWKSVKSSSAPTVKTNIFTARPPQTLSFSATTAEYDLYTPGAFVKPTLSGYQTTVTYDSSDKTVATVDADGTVHPLSVGTTTITATATGTAEYQGATATYTLTITNSDPNKLYYNKITSLDAIEDEAVYLIVRENGKKAFKPVLESSGSSFVSGNDANAVSVTIESEKIEATSNVKPCQVILKKDSESNYFIMVPQAGGSSLYLVPTRSGSSWNATYSFAALSTPTSASISWNSTNSSFNITYFSYSSGYFRAASSSSSLALYMLDDGQPKDQHLSFSKDVVTFNIYGKETPVALTGAPTLSGAKTAVTWSSSNTTVAEVDNEGAVTVKAVGETIITATAEATEKYNEGEASYRIVVTNQALPYYTKINSIDDLPGTSQTSATGNYIFVYESGSKAYVFKAICNGTPSGSGTDSSGHVELTKEGSAIEVDLTADGILATDAVKECKIELSHHDKKEAWNIKPASLGTYWVRVYNAGSNNVRILAMTSAGYSGTFTFTGTGNNLEIKRTDSKRDAYWSYNATDNCFEATATASKISIYKLSE